MSVFEHVIFGCAPNSYRTIANRKTLPACVFRYPKNIAMASLLLVVFTGVCRSQTFTTTEKGLLGGAALGAGTGAIVGAAVHHPVKGALIGGGLGAVTGGVVGHALQTREQAEGRLQSEVSAQQREIERQRREIQELQQEQDTE
jgi:outer membrane lipoprotein SlyB